MNFSDINKARAYIREMDEEATAAIGDHEVWQYDAGDIEIVEPGSQPSEEGGEQIGVVSEVLY